MSKIEQIYNELAHKTALETTVYLTEAHVGGIEDIRDFESGKYKNDNYHILYLACDMGGEFSDILIQFGYLKELDKYFKQIEQAFEGAPLKTIMQATRNSINFREEVSITRTYARSTKYKGLGQELLAIYIK